MELEKKYTIQDNFIGTFDNFFSDKIIEDYLEYFKFCSENKLTYGREEEIFRKDQSIDLIPLEEKNLRYINKPFIETFFNTIYPLYVKKFTHLQNLEKHTIHAMKMQKTKPTEGYHIWHCENDNKEFSHRLLAFSLYLNYIEEGGETEFLYQSCRIKPVRNRLVIWPAYFTHVHRGNPPLKNDKYIITGWVEYA